MIRQEADLTTTLVEIAEDFGVTIKLGGNAIPIKDEVRGACDLLGYDPLYLANEGKAIIIVANEDKDKVLQAIRQCPEGQDAECIGRVTDTSKGQLLIETPLGVKRALHRLSGVMLPRIREDFRIKRKSILFGLKCTGWIFLPFGKSTPCSWNDRKEFKNEK